MNKRITIVCYLLLAFEGIDLFSQLALFTIAKVLLSNTKHNYCAL